MSDALNKVQPGDLLKIPAATLNAFVDAAGNPAVKKSVAVYVEKVYEEGDFSALGIGT